MALSKFEVYWLQVVGFELVAAEAHWLQVVNVGFATFGLRYNMVYGHGVV